MISRPAASGASVWSWHDRHKATKGLRSKSEPSWERLRQQALRFDAPPEFLMESFGQRRGDRLFSLLASGQIKLRRFDGWRKIATVLSQPTTGEA
jgi:hypothetical protein